MLISFPLTHLMYFWCFLDSPFVANPTIQDIAIMEAETRSACPDRIGSIRMIPKKEAIEARTPKTVRRPVMLWILAFSGVSLNSISSPWYFTLPSSTSQVASPIDTRDVTDFPQPDSPTRPMICPSSTLRSTDWRASMGPSSVSKWTLSPSTSIIFFATISPPVLGIHYVPYSVPKKIESENGDGYG